MNNTELKCKVKNNIFWLNKSIESISAAQHQLQQVKRDMCKNQVFLLDAVMRNTEAERSFQAARLEVVEKEINGDD